MKKSLMTLCLIAALGVHSQTSSSTSTKQTSITSISTYDVNSKSSITRSKGSYEFDAKFDKKKYESVKELLLDELGTSNLRVKGKTHEWIREKVGGEYFNCRLTNVGLYLSLNLEVASYDFADQIDELGDDLRDLIQTHTPQYWSSSTPTPPTPPMNPNSQDPQLAKDELRQAELELERAKRKVERLKKKKGSQH